MLHSLIALVLLSPVPASYVGAALAGHPELGHTLAAIAQRESSGAWVSIHPGDRWAARIAWRRALSRGWLSASCVWHSSPGGLSTRGAHGMIAAYSLHVLGPPCLPPVLLDIPIVSAFAATRRATSKACERAARCRSWRSPDPPDEPGWDDDPTIGGANLGLFVNELDAALAYDAFAREHYGDFARTNADRGLLPGEEAGS